MEPIIFKYEEDVNLELEIEICGWRYFETWLDYGVEGNTGDSGSNLV